MKYVLNLLYCLSFFLSVHSQDFSNKGKEFWVGYGSHVAMYEPDYIRDDNGDVVLNSRRGLPMVNGGNQEMVLYFSSDRKAKVRVEIPGISWSDQYDVEPGIVKVSAPMPKSGAKDSRILDEKKSNTGIHIVSDVPIIVYAHIYNENQSGAALLYPVNVLSNEYYSLNFTQNSNNPYSFSYCYVIATENNTEIEIIPASNTSKGNKNIPIKVTINKG
jgi:hypothetical protein